MKMISKILKSMKDFLFINVSEGYKEDFDISTNKTNVTRVKITAATFIIWEIILLFISLIIEKGESVKGTNIYYNAMYVLLIAVMAVFFFIFRRYEKNVPQYGASIQIGGVIFTVFLLLWCAGISLLDQLSYGQIIIYTVALISIAVVPVFSPINLLKMYLGVQILFIALMPYFQKSGIVLNGNYINSTLFVVIAWVISAMRYKSWINDFNNRKLIQQKNEELNKMNMELEKVNLKLEKLSHTDSLTGIFNRLVFDHTIEAEWNRCKRYFIPLSLIMIDIDFFKTFNDNYGHQAGDSCIRQVAEALSSSVKRSSDVVARYGGEEFAVILPHTDKVQALEIAEQMRNMVEELAIPHEYSSASSCVTISLGVHTTIPSSKLSTQEFIRTADKALFEAKKMNRNNVVVA